MLEKKIYESCIASRYNPFVYKEYFLDEETGFYYLKSRYYDPTIRRFISIDSPQYIDQEDLSELNLYAYCGNNPVMFADPSGHFAITTLILIGLGVGAFIGAAASVVGQAATNNWDFSKINPWQVVLDGVLGGISGALSMSPLGWGALIGLNAAIGFVGGVGGHLINGSDFSDPRTWIDIGLSTGIGTLIGVVGGPGATSAATQNAAKHTAGFIKATASYDKVLTKIAAGGYKNLAGAAGARHLTGMALTKAWNHMVTRTAGIALAESLAFGGIALLAGSAGKGFLGNWIYSLFWE